MKRTAFLLLLLLVVLRTGCTDLSGIKFEYLTVDDGLSQGIIEDILQDRQGFMWFATRDGLDRYDGIQFTIFRNDRDDSQSLASNWILSLAEDRSGKIWIGSKGLNIYDPVLDKMTRVAVDPDDRNAFHGGSVYSITVDTDSTLWFSTLNGLVHYMPRQRIFKTYVHDPKDPNSIGNTTVFSTCVTHDNRLFVGANADPIYEYDREKDVFHAITYKKAYPGNNNLKYIREGPDGMLYITAEFAALHILNPSTDESKLLDKTEGQLNSASIKTPILPVSASEVWIGTDGGGVNVYNPATGHMQYLMMDTHNSHSLSGNAIFRMYKDRDGNIWVGHFGSGLSVWKRTKEKFTSYSNNPFNTASINREVVCAIFEDSKGRIWVGQDGGGLSLFHEDSKSFEHFRSRPGDPTSLVNDIILTIHEDPEGNLLLGTYSGGMMVFNPETRRVIKTFTPKDGLGSPNVWAIFKDNRSRYWISTLSSGFGVYDPEKQTFRNYTPSTTDLTSCSSSIMNIAEDPQGRLWFGTEDAGVCVVDYDKKTTKNYQHDEQNKNSISYNDVKSIVFLDHYAWIATNGGGLNQLDLKTDSFKVFTMANGLSSNALEGILKDAHNNLWISSTRGLMKFNPVTYAVEIFDKTQGIQGSEFKYNAQCQLRDGRMIFGGVNGITLFNPDSIRNSSIVPPVVFTDFKIFNQSVVPGAKNSPLINQINYTRYIRLNHKQSTFTLEFASLDFTTPSRNNYQYKLEGFDDKWIDAGHRNFVTYSNLNAGKYTFLLKGSNSDGVWNETPRSLVIRVRPPWYKTLVSLILFGLAAIYLIYFYIKSREKQSVHDKRVLQEKIQEARKELDQKAGELDHQRELLEMRNKADKELRYMTEGIARISDIIAGNRKNLEELTTTIIAELVRYTEASAGAIYVADNSDPEHVSLRILGEYAGTIRSKRKYVFEAGEGYIGACYTERSVLAMDDLPDGYVVLKSGLGELSLRHLIAVPILQDELCIGVIEMASADKIPEFKVSFVQKSAESMASVITIIRTSEKANEMLEQNSIQSEELHSQEEEMRQTIEELKATQESSQRKEQEQLNELERMTRKVEELQEIIRQHRVSGNDN